MTLQSNQPQYPTTTRDVIYSIVQCLLSRNTFLHFAISQKATRAAAYFCLFITTESEERLAVTSPRTISMHYKSCRVNSEQLFMSFQKSLYIKIAIKMQ